MEGAQRAMGSVARTNNTAGNSKVNLHLSKNNEKPYVDLKRAWSGKYGSFCPKSLW